MTKLVKIDLKAIDLGPSVRISTEVVGIKGVHIIPHSAIASFTVTENDNGVDLVNITNIAGETFQCEADQVDISDFVKEDKK